MFARTCRLSATLVLSLAAAATAQQPAERIDADLNAKIRTEGLDHSKIMWIEHFLTDVYGPRPIGSPNHVAAANWAVKTMTSWGMKNAHLEPFTWRGVGWLPGTRDRLHHVAGQSEPQVRGGAVVAVDQRHGQRRSREHRRAGLADRGGADGVSRAARVEGEGRHRHDRRAAERAGELQRASEAHARRSGQGALPARSQCACRGRGGRGGGPGGGRGGRGAQTPPPEGHLSAQQVNQRITAFLRDNLPALRLNAQGGGRIPGVIVAQNGAGQIYDDTTPQPPAVILRTDDYGRIFRIIADGTPVHGRVQRAESVFPRGQDVVRDRRPRFPAPTRPTKS